MVCLLSSKAPPGCRTCGCSLLATVVVLKVVRCAAERRRVACAAMGCCHASSAAAVKVPQAGTCVDSNERVSSPVLCGQYSRHWSGYVFVIGLENSETPKRQH